MNNRSNWNLLLINENLTMNSLSRQSQIAPMHWPGPKQSTTLSAAGRDRSNCRTGRERKGGRRRGATASRLALQTTAKAASTNRGISAIKQELAYKYSWQVMEQSWRRKTVWWIGIQFWTSRKAQRWIAIWEFLSFVVYSFWPNWLFQDQIV